MLSPPSSSPTSDGSYLADGITAPTADWLVSLLLPKTAKWAEESARGCGGKRVESLVPLGRYSTLHHRLKAKYGPEFVQVG